MAAAGVLIGLLTWWAVRPSAPATIDRDEIVQLAANHARRSALFLREYVKAEHHPEEALRADYALSGLEDLQRQLGTLPSTSVPEEASHYVRTVVPLISTLGSSVVNGVSPDQGRETARAILDGPTLNDVAARWKGSPRRFEAPAVEGEPALRCYLAGRAALYAGDSAGAIASFRKSIQEDPTGRYRDGAAYWQVQAALSLGQPKEAAVACYSALGSSWLEVSDRSAIEKLVKDLRQAPREELAVIVHAPPPRGGAELRLPLSDLLQFLEDGGERPGNGVAIRQQLVTILIHADWTIVQGDLDPRVVRAFLRIRSFYPNDVKVTPGPPASVRMRNGGIEAIRSDPALKKEVDDVRRAIPLMWK